MAVESWGQLGEMQASSGLHGGFNLHPPAKNAENSLSKKLPRRLRPCREAEIKRWKKRERKRKEWETADQEEEMVEVVEEMPEEKGVRDRKRVHDGRNEIVRAWITVDFVIPSN